MFQDHKAFLATNRRVAPPIDIPDRDIEALLEQLKKIQA